MRQGNLFEAEREDPFADIIEEMMREKSPKKKRRLKRPDVLVDALQRIESNFPVNDSYDAYPDIHF